MTTEQYLQSSVLPNYMFSPEAIQASMLPKLRYEKNGIEPGTNVNEVPERELDLAQAELWDIASGLVNGGGSRKSFGNRSYTDMSIQTSQQDRSVWRNNANSLRRKWGIKTSFRESGVEDYTYLWK